MFAKVAMPRTISLLISDSKCDIISSMPKQIAVRLPDQETLDKIDARAEKVGLSRNAWITKALEWALNQPISTRTKQEHV